MSAIESTLVLRILVLLHRPRKSFRGSYLWFPEMIAFIPFQSNPSGQFLFLIPGIHHSEVIAHCSHLPVSSLFFLPAKAQIYRLRLYTPVLYIFQPSWEPDGRRHCCNFLKPVGLISCPKGKKPCQGIPSKNNRHFF